jgi:type IV fimbrial biogenesis protein FimT
MRFRTRGFTLPELLVVLAIAATILGLAVPNFNRFRLNNRLTNTANDVLAGIVKARNEAIKLQVDVSLCASDNPGAEEPECTDGGTAGYILFQDENRDCLRDLPGEALLGGYTYEVSFETTNPLLVRSNGNCISFASTGFRQDIADRVTLTRLVYCDNRGTALQPGTTMSAARGIFVSRTGRTRITRVTTGSGAANGEGRAEDISTWADATCP